MVKIVKKIYEEDISYIKSTRNDKYNNIAKDFIEPCLSECEYFRRDTGWFQSSALKAWVGALQHLIEKDEKNIRLEYLCSPGTDRRTIEAIKKSKTPEEKEKILQKSKDKLILDTILLAAADDIHKVSTSDKTIAQALAHLIVTEKLEIRFAEVKDLENLIIITDEDEDPQIYHPKLGYFKFPDGTEVTFNGSVNESYGGLKKQGEYIDIFCSLDDSHTKKIQTHKKILDDAWEGKEEGTRIIKTSDKTKEELDKFLKSNPIKGKRTTIPVPEPTPETALHKEKNRKLRSYQEVAIQSWINNDHHGILEHATGSGKTFTALNIMKKIYEKDNSFIVVGVPLRPLGEQWFQEIENFFINQSIECSIVQCWSDHTDWGVNGWHELIERKKAEAKGKQYLVIFIVVNDSLSKFSDKFYEKNEFDLNRCLFIGDECHNYTTPNYLTSLPESKYKLGLSATPTVNPEEPREGEVSMMQYFGNVCHTFTLEEGIPKYLCNYYYYPKECYLTEEEFDAWKKLWGQTGWSEDEDVGSKGPIFGRMAKILGSAEDKLRVLKKILPKDHESKAHSLIFCGQGKDENGIRDIEKAASLLRELGWSPSRITNEENDPNLRKKIINNFVEGRTDGLLAIKVLDEGIDIPEIRTAYILASSTNRRQFIQRRGRVLRKIDGIDKVAKIYDLIVIPPENDSNAAKKLIEKELNRVEQMSSKALNKEDIDIFIKERLTK